MVRLSLGRKPSVKTRKKSGLLVKILWISVPKSGGEELSSKLKHFSFLSQKTKKLSLDFLW